MRIIDKNLYTVLSVYGFAQPLEIVPIYKSALQNDVSTWQINNDYILKKNDEQEKDIEKSLMINNFLREEGILVVEYIKTVSGKLYTVFDDDIYSLMRKMNGNHIHPSNPLSGDYISTAHNIGFEMARLHKALKKLGNTIVYESNLMSELKTQLDEIKANNIELPYEIIGSCLDFEASYNLLQKQLIHRDIHFGNMLFENGRITSFLDFDSSQVNARLFDIAYLGQSMLFINDNYKNNEFVKRWSQFFTSLLYSYHNENKLDEIEINSIHMMCVLLQIGFVSYYLSIEEKKPLIQNRIDMAKWMYNNESIFTFLLS